MNDLNGFSAALADLTAQVALGVVTVHAARRISGVAVEGGLLTVAHVLSGDEVAVTDADGSVRQAQVAGRDPVSDLALLRVDGLTATPLAQAAQPQVGELALAVARPDRVQAAFGLLADAGEAGQWWRADARPFPGVSGGAVVNTRGELLGVANAGAARGQLLLVPVARALKVAAQLASTGRVPQGYLGVSTQPVRLRLNEGGSRSGLTLVGVESGSPAEAGGLRPGDILLTVEGQRVGRPDTLLGFVRERAGQAVTLSVLRGGEEQSLPVTLGER